MKKYYKLFSILTACAITLGAPLSAMCAEMPDAGDTSVMMQTEQADEIEPTDEIEPEAASAAEQVADEASAETDGNEVVTESVLEPSVAGGNVPSKGFCGEELEWEYREGKLYITGKGEMYDYDKEFRPEWDFYKETIEEVHIGKDITLIDGDAFTGMTVLKDVYYEGSPVDWEKLEYIGETEKKDLFEDTEFHFGVENEEVEVPEGEATANSDTSTVDVAAGDATSSDVVSESAVDEADSDEAAVADGTVSGESESGEPMDDETESGESEEDQTEAGQGGENGDTPESGDTPGAEADSLLILSGPEDVEALDGETVEFHVEVNMEDASYQWQMSANGTTWKNCTGAGYNTDTFSFVMKEKFAGRRYRCVVSASGNSVTSGAALLSLKQVGGILEQPEDVEASDGETATFHIVYSGAAPAYQWKWSVDGTVWKNCTGAGYNTDTFSFVMKEKFAGRQYKCVVMDEGVTYTSDPAVLSLKNSLRITAQPEDVTVAAGETAVFHIEAEGGSLSYQWQMSANGTTWTNCQSGSYNTDTFSFVMKEKFAGRRYRCVVTGGGESCTSEAAVLSLGSSDLQIVSEPEDVVAVSGEEVVFHVEAAGNNLSYQWKWSSDGTAWKNCLSGAYNTDTFSFLMKEKFAGRQYKCVVTNGDKTVTTRAASVMLAEEGLEILEQPESVETTAGSSVSLHVLVNKEDAAYQWQMSANGTTWRNCTGTGYNTDTFSFVMKDTFNNRQYRCKVTWGQESLITESAVVTIKQDKYEIDGVIYELIDNVMTVTGYTGSAETVVVQETVNDCPVTTIGESAFEGSTIREIDLPDTIQLIKKRAFADCSNLVKMD